MTGVLYIIPYITNNRGTLLWNFSYLASVMVTWLVIGDVSVKITLHFPCHCAVKKKATTKCTCGASKTILTFIHTHTNKKNIKNIIKGSNIAC